MNRRLDAYIKNFEDRYVNLPDTCFYKSEYADRLRLMKEIQALRYEADSIQELVEIIRDIRFLFLTEETDDILTDIHFLFDQDDVLLRQVANSSPPSNDPSPPTTTITLAMNDDDDSLTHVSDDKVSDATPQDTTLGIKSAQVKVGSLSRHANTQVAPSSDVENSLLAPYEGYAVPRVDEVNDSVDHSEKPQFKVMKGSLEQSRAKIVKEMVRAPVFPQADPHQNPNPKISTTAMEDSMYDEFGNYIDPNIAVSRISPESDVAAGKSFANSSLPSLQSKMTFDPGGYLSEPHLIICHSDSSLELFPCHSQITSSIFSEDKVISDDNFISFWLLPFTALFSDDNLFTQFPSSDQFSANILIRLHTIIPNSLDAFELHTHVFDSGLLHSSDAPTSPLLLNSRLFEETNMFDKMLERDVPWSVKINWSSRFARLQKVHCSLAGRNLYMKFCGSTGDAMGMCMVTKGVQNVLDYIQNGFLDVEVIRISGNFYPDTKSAMVNSIEGRANSVVCEAIIKEEVVKMILKTSVQASVEQNTQNNPKDSSVARALCVFNTHARLIMVTVTASGAKLYGRPHCIPCKYDKFAPHYHPDIRTFKKKPPVHIGIQAFELMAIGAVGNNLITYVFNDMHFPLSKAANIVANFVGMVFLLSLLGSFWTTLFFRFVELSGFTLLSVQARLPQLRPSQCNILSTWEQCMEATGIKAIIFLIALYLVALGRGCLKPNMISNGADQFRKEDPNQSMKLSTYLNSAYFSFDVCDNDLQKDRLDLFYWLLAGLSMLNFFNYFLGSRWYSYNPSLLPNSGMEIARNNVSLDSSHEMKQLVAKFVANLPRFNVGFHIFDLEDEVVPKGVRMIRSFSVSI